MASSIGSNSMKLPKVPSRSIDEYQRLVRSVVLVRCSRQRARMTMTQYRCLGASKYVRVLTILLCIAINKTVIILAQYTCKREVHPLFCFSGRRSVETNCAPALAPLPQTASSTVVRPSPAPNLPPSSPPTHHLFTQESPTTSDIANQTP